MHACSCTAHVLDPDLPFEVVVEAYDYGFRGV